MNFLFARPILDDAKLPMRVEISLVRRELDLVLRRSYFLQLIDRASARDQAIFLGSIFYSLRKIRKFGFFIYLFRRLDADGMRFTWMENLRGPDNYAVVEKSLSVT